MHTKSTEQSKEGNRESNEVANQDGREGRNSEIYFRNGSMDSNE